MLELVVITVINRKLVKSIRLVLNCAYRDLLIALREGGYKKPIRDLSQEFTVGEYNLESWPDGRYWISNKIGEGSEVNRECVEKMFERLFKENF